MRVPARPDRAHGRGGDREARAQTRGLVELPDGEDVALEIVRDEPWLAFCEYLGDLRSRISVNVDLPMSAVELLVLAMHETYPGHHAERCCKEQALVRRRGLLEETIVLVPTPQSLVAEGIADARAAPAARGRRRRGARRGRRATPASTSISTMRWPSSGRSSPCRWAKVNAALMLHDAGASEAEVQAYLERWGLLTPELGRPPDPLPQGADVADLHHHLPPPGESSAARTSAGDPARFRRLLTEQVRVGELLAAGLDSTTPP